MKRILSVVSVVALVVSLAAVMTACKEPKAGDDTTAPAADTSAVTTEATADNPLSGFLDELEEEWSEYSTVEHTTDKHYEEDFEALTLPSAVPAAGTTKNASAATTKRAAATTQAVRRETTTQFQFTSPARKPSTTAAKSGSSTTSAAASTTKKNNAQTVDEQTSFSDTTSLTERITDEHVVNVSDAVEIPRPNVTYLDKFVIHVLQSGSYTMQTELKAEGYAMPMTTYSNADNFAVKMGTGAAMAEMMGMSAGLGKLGDIRMIATNMNTDPHLYMAWTGGYTELEGEGVDDIKEMFMDAESERSMLSSMQFDALVYCGYVTKQQGQQSYIVETYKLPEENLMYCFYFDGQGLAKWEIIDMTTDQVTESITVKLTAGVTDKDAFKVSGKKYTTAEMENMFGSLGV